MRLLIAATSSTPSNIEDQVRHGLSHRIDYIELSDRCPARYVDYGLVHDGGAVRWIENKLRLDVQMAFEVSRVVDRHKYDVVLSMSERMGIPLCGFLKRKTKHVMWAHHPLSPPKLRLMKLLRLSDKSDLIIVPTRADAEALQQELRLPPNRVKMMYIPVDTEFYNPCAAQIRSTDEGYVLSLGLAHRDYPTLVDAMRKLPQVTCHIGANSLWLQSALGPQRGNLPKNIQMKPYVPAAALRERYANSRFIVIPLRHKTTHWSAGTTAAMTAQAMGKAVIATRSPGITDYVVDGQTGILVEGGSSVAMAEAVEYLWNRPDEAARMGERGRKWAEATFSLDNWVDDMIITLKSVAN